MKLLVVLVLVSVVNSVPQTASRAASSNDVQLLRYESENNGLGTYSFSYDQSDGQQRDEDGELRFAGTDSESYAVRGFYAWIDPDGQSHNVAFTADENGFQPTLDGALPAGLKKILEKLSES